MTLQLVGRIATGDAPLDGDLRDIDIVTTEAGSLLFAATGQSGGVSVWSVSDTGALARLADSAYFSVWGMGIGSFDAVEIDGQTQLILSGTGAGKLIRYRIAENGALSKAGKIDLPGSTTQTHDALTTVTLTGGRTALYTVDTDTGALAGWLSSGNGALDRDIGFATPMDTLDTNDPVLLTQTEAGGVRYLLTADNSGSGVRSYRVDADTGRLTEVDSCGAEDGLGLALPTALETVTAHGATWVVLAAAGSGSLSVMQLAANGTLIPTDHILDTRATRFGGVTALEVIEADVMSLSWQAGRMTGSACFTCSQADIWCTCRLWSMKPGWDWRMSPGSPPSGWATHFRSLSVPEPKAGCHSSRCHWARSAR